MEQACRAPLNKALCSVLRISLETSSDVPALLWSPVVQGLLPFNCPCLLLGRGSTQEPQLLFIYFFTVATICIFLHQNLPQFFAETMSPTVLLIFWIISPMYLDYFVKTSSPIHFWWRSWPWKPFWSTSIIRRMHREIHCFVSNLHVSGFSSCRII